MIPTAPLASCHEGVGLTTSDEASGVRLKGRDGQGAGLPHGLEPALRSGSSRRADGEVCELEE